MITRQAFLTQLPDMRAPGLKQERREQLQWTVLLCRNPGSSSPAYPCLSGQIHLQLLSRQLFPDAIPQHKELLTKPFTHGCKLSSSWHPTGPSAFYPEYCNWSCWTHVIVLGTGLAPEGQFS